MKRIINLFNIQGDYIDVHDNASVQIIQKPQNFAQATSSSVEEVMSEPATTAPVDIEEKFKYIHVSVTNETERSQIHLMVHYIVRLPRMKLICDELYQLMRQGKILTSIKPEAMLEELRRMGMPPANQPGFSDQNFYSNYKV